MEGELVPEQLRMRVEAELARYEHLLVEFSAQRKEDDSLELVIRLKNPPEGAHVYRAPIHPRDAAGPQFAWNFQRYLYDCLHDYLVEMFVRTPQSRDSR
jgi:hypothetical protein